MKKLNKKDFIYLAIIFVSIMIYVLLYTNVFKFTYGSKVDWDVQHWIIPDSLRTLFYSKGNIFSNLFLNLGAGQNIFYYAYYGFLSPFILLSFILPFIPMYIYIQVITIVSILTSVVLFYVFILKKTNSNIAFASTIILLTMNPILYHTHRHIMFVIYYPFLILGLYAIDNYFKSGKWWQISICTFLLIITNYFYSVPSLICLYIYGLSQLYKLKNKKRFKELILITIPFIIGVLLASFIILPVFYTLFFGRSASNTSINLLELLIPDISLSKSFYAAYSIGLNIILLFSLLYFVFYRKEKDSTLISIILIVMLTFPLFAYVINATMYVDYKIFIPFCPLVAYNFANCIKTFNNKKINTKNIYLSLAIVALIVILNLLLSNNNVVMLLDALFLLFLLMLIVKDKKTLAYTLFCIVIIGVIIYSSTYTDKKYNINTYNKVKNEYEIMYSNYLSKDPSLYRVSYLNGLLQSVNYIYNENIMKTTTYSSVSNNFYKRFFFEDSGNDISQRSYGKIVDVTNPYYNTFMGVKYIYSSLDVIPGYTKIDDNIFINEKALPLLYASNKIMNSKEYSSLEYPYNMEAYLKYIIIDQENDNEVFDNKISEFNPVIKNNNEIIKLEDKYDFTLTETTKYEYSIDNWKSDEAIIIAFDLKPNKCKRDLEIRINGITNVLSCEQWKYYNQNDTFKFVLGNNSQKIDVELLKGEYHISNIRFYKFNESSLVVDDIDTPTSLYIDGESIKGEIEVSEENSYALLTIPYDNGFSIIVDGNKIEYEKVNQAFIGFKIDKGIHEIEIRYASPLFKEGIVISSITIAIYVLLRFKWKKKED